MFLSSSHQEYGSIDELNFVSFRDERQVQVYHFYHIVYDNKVAKFSGIRQARNITESEKDLANATQGMNGYTKRVVGPFTTENEARKDMDRAKEQWKA